MKTATKFRRVIERKDDPKSDGWRKELLVSAGTNSSVTKCGRNEHQDCNREYLQGRECYEAEAQPSSLHWICIQVWMSSSGQT